MRWPRAFAATIALLLVYAVPAPLRAEAPESYDPAASCVSGECHSEIGQHPNLHWADFTGPEECLKCHESEGNLHDFTVEDAPDLCYACHEDVQKEVDTSKRVHEAAEDCLDCHDAHGGEVKALLLEVSDEDDLKPLCFSCHDEDILDGEFTHGPVDQGACIECHEPHAAQRRNLLRAEPGLALCGGCHEEIADELKAAEFVHEPVPEGCTDCHNPHSSPYPNMLLDETLELCNECHDDIVDIANDSSVRHSPTTTKAKCLNCHAPHAANDSPNLKKPQIDLCLGCHDEPIKAGTTVLTNMKKLLSESDVWHEPIGEDGCASCHQPHGSENARLLEKAFPAQFYSKFRLASYRLCFSCHESRMVTSKRSRSATAFRDGDENLHFLHVNRAKKGRTCRACHDMHASSHFAQVRDRVRFGRWQMPLNFKKTATGGSCLPGCHTIQAYDRGPSSGSEEP